MRLPLKPFAQLESSLHFVALFWRAHFVIIAVSVICQYKLGC